MLAAMLLLPCVAQEWKHWGGDEGGTRFSRLKQINRSNVSKLEVAWTYRTGDSSDGKDLPFRSTFEATPLVVDGTLYITTGFGRLIALDAETGRELWKFDPKVDLDRAYNLYISRGLLVLDRWAQEAHSDGHAGCRLFSIDASDGRPDKAFGNDGFIDLRAGVADKFPEQRLWSDVCSGHLQESRDHGRGRPDGEPQGPSGDIRAFDIGSGKLVWTFHTVPRSRRVRKRDLGGRVVERSRRRECVEYVECRPAAGHSFCPAHFAGNRHLRRRPAGRESVWRRAGGSRGRYRQAHLAFPDHSPQSLGL